MDELLCIIHMDEILRHDQSVVADERFARGFDSLLPVRGEWEVCCAGVSSVEGPFGFAVADDEAAWCHGLVHCEEFCLAGVGWNWFGWLWFWFR